MMKWEQSDTQKVIIASAGFVTGVLITTTVIFLRLMWLGYVLSWMGWMLFWMLAVVLTCLFIIAWAVEVWKSVPTREDLR